MRQLLAGLALAIAAWAGPGLAVAADLPATAAEASLQVRGTIDIDAQGAVVAHSIRNESSFDDAIVDLVGRIVPSLRFEPVVRDGLPTAARADMNLVFVARQRDDDSVAVALRSAWFGAPGAAAKIIPRERLSPQFPEHLMRDRVSGTAFVILRILPEGRVAEAIAEQVNLRRSGSEREMTRWRRDLGRAAVTALERWEFAPFEPAGGADAASVRVPVDFILPGTAGAQAHALPGRWDAYLPGPRATAPWRTGDRFAEAGIDAVPEGVFQEIGSGLKLLTPLNAP